MTADQIAGKPHCSVGGTVIRLKKIGPHKEDETAVFSVCLPVELLSVRKFAVHVLFADSLASEIQRTLTYRSVTVSVGGAEALCKTLVQIASSSLEPAPGKHDLVVTRPEIRMIRIDKLVQCLRRACS